MKFAFAGIDFLGGVFEALVGAGWTPIKLFTRPCDGLYDHNEAVVAQCPPHRVPMQISRMKPPDLDALGGGARHGLGPGRGRLSLAGAGLAGPGGLRRQFPPLARFPWAAGPTRSSRRSATQKPDWGVTAHVLAEEGFDTGDILAQERFPLSPLESHETLLAKCQMAARRLAAGPIARRPARRSGRRRRRRAQAPTGRG